MFLTMLLLLNLLLLRRRLCSCAGPLPTAVPAHGHLQTGEILLGEGHCSTHLEWWHMKRRRSAAQNAEATDPPPAVQNLDFWKELTGAVTGQYGP